MVSMGESSGRLVVITLSVNTGGLSFTSVTSIDTVAELDNGDSPSSVAMTTNKYEERVSKSSCV